MHRKCSMTNQASSDDSASVVRGTSPKGRFRANPAQAAERGRSSRVRSTRSLRLQCGNAFHLRQVGRRGLQGDLPCALWSRSGSRDVVRRSSATSTERGSAPRSVSETDGGMHDDEFTAVAVVAVTKTSDRVRTPGVCHDCLLALLAPFRVRIGTVGVTRGARAGDCLGNGAIFPFRSQHSLRVTTRSQAERYDDAVERPRPAVTTGGLGIRATARVPARWWTLRTGCSKWIARANPVDLPLQSSLS